MRRFFIAAGLAGLLGAGFWATQPPPAKVPLPVTNAAAPVPQVGASTPSQQGVSPKVDLPSTATVAAPPPVVVDAEKATDKKAPAVAAVQPKAIPTLPAQLPAALRTAAAPPLTGATPADAAASVAAPIPPVQVAVPELQRPVARTMVPPKNGDIPGQSTPVLREPPLRQDSGEAAAKPSADKKPAKAASQVSGAVLAKRFASKPRAVTPSRSAQRATLALRTNARTAFLAPDPRLAPLPRRAPSPRVGQIPM